MNDNYWYEVTNIDNVDSPALLLFSERMESNLGEAIHMTGTASRLRPHVKTSKIAEVCELMMQKGITKFKCATIAEAEMLGMIEAPDVLLAYQPVGPKMDRFISLIEKYPSTLFSCLLDNKRSATELGEKAFARASVIPVFVDLNVGMNRTGTDIADAAKLATVIEANPYLELKGLHAYDGHINDTDLAIRKQRSDAALEPVFTLRETLKSDLNREIILIAGGTPTFPIHATRSNVECSPGTFIFWDDGYATQFPDLPFQPAAVLATRIISIVNSTTVCTDLGHKAVAPEMLQPRVNFLNLEGVQNISQSEEHMSITVSNSAGFFPGQVFYAVPKHVCPTVALHERAFAVRNNEVTEEWKIIARDRRITI